MAYDDKTVFTASLIAVIVIGLFILLVIVIITIIGMCLIYNNTKLKYTTWELVLNNYDTIASVIEPIGVSHPAYNAFDNKTYWWLGDPNDGKNTWEMVKNNSKGSYSLVDNVLTASTGGLYDMNIELNFVNSGGLTPKFDLIVEYVGSSYPYSTTSSVIDNEIYAGTGNKLFNIISRQEFVNDTPYPYTTLGPYTTMSCNFNKRMYLNTNDKLKFWICTKTDSSNSTWGFFNTKRHPQANTMSIAIL